MATELPRNPRSGDIAGTNIGLAQIAASAFGVDVEQVRIMTGDTDSTPLTGLSAGSKTIYTAPDRSPGGARGDGLSSQSGRESPIHPEGGTPMRSRIVRCVVLPVVVVVAVLVLSRPAPAPTAVEYALPAPPLTFGQAAELAYYNTSDHRVQAMLTIRNLEGQVVNKPSAVDVPPGTGLILPYIEQDNVDLHGVHTMGVLRIMGPVEKGGRRPVGALYIMDERGTTQILIGLSRL